MTNEDANQLYGKLDVQFLEKENEAIEFGVDMLTTFAGYRFEACWRHPFYAHR